MSILGAFKAVDQALKVLLVTEGVLELSDSKPASSERESENEITDTNQESNMSDEQETRTLIEEIELEGKYLVNRIKELIHEGNIRRLRIKDSKGKYLLEVPLTVGVVAGGVFALTSPVWAALGTLAAAMAKLTIEIERVVEDEDAEPEGAADEE